MKEETVGKIVITGARITGKTLKFLGKAISKTTVIAIKMAGKGIYAAGNEGIKSLKGGIR